MPSPGRRTDSHEHHNPVLKHCSFVFLYAMTSLITEPENQESMQSTHLRHEVSRMDSRYNPVTFTVA